MDRLSIILTFFTGSVIAGGLVILFLTLGWVGWTPIVVAALAGLVLSWPAAYLISRRIKRQDPEFDHTRAKSAGPVPDPNAREV